MELLERGPLVLDPLADAGKRLDPLAVVGPPGLGGQLLPQLPRKIKLFVAGGFFHQRATLFQYRRPLLRSPGGLDHLAHRGGLHLQRVHLVNPRHLLGRCEGRGRVPRQHCQLVRRVQEHVTP